MNVAFHTLQQFLTYTKGGVYLLMGAALIVYLLYWLFLTGRDEENRTF